MADCAPAPSTIVVLSLSIVIFLALPRSSILMFSSLMPRSSVIARPPVSDRDVLEHGLAAIAEARRLDGRDLQRAAQLVDDERRERFAVHVLGDDHERTSAARHLLEQRQEVLHRADLLLVDQDDGVLEHGFHALGIGHEVRREVAAVELHALDDVERRLHGARFLDRDDAVLADLLHRFRDDLADRVIAVGRDRADLADHVAAHRLRELLELARR